MTCGNSRQLEDVTYKSANIHRLSHTFNRASTRVVHFYVR